jgi:hypothetical protein
MPPSEYIPCYRRGESRINGKRIASQYIHPEVCMKKEFRPTSKKCAYCAKQRGTTIKVLKESIR